MTRMAAATTMWQLGRPTDAEPDRSAAVCGSRGPSRQSITVLLVTLVLASAAGLEPLHGQSEEPGLREDVEAQFQVTPMRGGIGLLPRDPNRGVNLIELRGGAVYLDGQAEPRSAQELAATLGSDAALLLRLMYLDAAAQRAVLGLPPLTEAESSSLVPSEPVAEAVVDAQTVESASPPARQRRVVRRDIVRFGGSVQVDVDERVRGDIVVIGGSLTVDGEVHGDVTVVGGSARFGPEAIAHRDVTVIGGRLTRAPGAQFSRGVNEVTFDMIDFDFLDFGGFPWIRLPRPPGPMLRSLDLVGTLIRFAFFGLLGSLVLLLAADSVQRVATRVTREPIKAGLVGFLAQLLFVPLLVVGSLLLAVTIIGIPLLVLVPVVVVVALLVMLLGFTGVAQGVGQLVTRGGVGTRWTAVALFWLGLAIVMIPTLSGEAFSLAGGPFRLFAVTLGLVGFVAEYVAWTSGVGAVILNRFGGPGGSVVGPPSVPVPAAAEPAPLIPESGSADPPPSDSDTPPSLAPDDDH